MVQVLGRTIRLNPVSSVLISDLGHKYFPRRRRPKPASLVTPIKVLPNPQPLATLDVDKRVFRRFSFDFLNATKRVDHDSYSGTPWIMYKFLATGTSMLRGYLTFESLCGASRVVP